MKLAILKKEHLVKAAEEMNIEGDTSWAEYWIQMDNGKEYQFKHLVKRAYEIAIGKKVRNDFFQNNLSYRAFIEKEFGFRVVFKVPDNISFFTAKNLEFFSIYANQQYRKGEKNNELAGIRIKDEIYYKTNAWIRSLNLRGWSIELDTRWQIAGRFKAYSWARIYKMQDKKEKVFFTLGVEGQEKILLYKLDCQRKDFTPGNALSKNQISAFDRIVRGTGAEWNPISITDLKKLNWEKLQQITNSFISRYEFLYYEAVEAVKTTTGVEELFTKNSLIEYPIPNQAYDKLPTKMYSFNGEIIDYDAENKSYKEIGDEGEKLVISFEKKTLFENGLEDLSNQVKKVKDGKGYDVLSFDIGKKVKYIEVKTTTGIKTRPFRMSDNEWQFMLQHPENYHLYRVYDFDKDKKQAKFFQLAGNIEKMVYTRPKEFEVFLKTTCENE